MSTVRENAGFFKKLFSGYLKAYSAAKNEKDIGQILLYIKNKNLSRESSMKAENVDKIIRLYKNLGGTVDDENKKKNTKNKKINVKYTKKEKVEYSKEKYFDLLNKMLDGMRSYLQNERESQKKLKIKNANRLTHAYYFVLDNGKNLEKLKDLELLTDEYVRETQDALGKY